MKKIFLIPLLALFCSVSLWAEGETYVAKILEEGKAEVKATSLSDLNTKIEALTNPATVTLLKSVNISDPTQAVTFHVPAGKNVTLNLNGYNIIQTFTIKDNGTDYVAYGNFTFGGFGDINENALIYNEGTLHIVSEGSSIVQMISAASPAGSATTICNGNPSEGKAYLTIDGGIFTGPIGRIPEMGWTLKLPVIWSMGTNSEITINGGTFLCDESKSDYAMGPIFGPISGGGTWNIKGGIFSTSDEVYRVADGYATKTDHKSTKDHWLTSTTGKALPEGYEAIDVPYTNANITGYHDRIVANERNESTKPGYLNPKKVCVVVPTTNRYEVTTNENTTGNADYNFVYVDPGKTLTIKDGHKVTVGDAGVILGGTDSKIIIEAGGTLVSGGDIVTSSEENLELTMDAVRNQYSYLMIKPFVIQAKHPNATVKLISKGHDNGDGTYAWQRFAVPTYHNNLQRQDMKYNNNSQDPVEDRFPTALYKWNYSSNAWDPMNNPTDGFEAFQCYDMTTTNTSEKRATYTFQCELVGNGDAVLPMTYGTDWNYFANSYTAPINLKALTEDLMANQGGNISASVYIHKINGDAWDVVTYRKARNDASLKIEPMQAFVFYKDGTTENYTMNYDKLIYTPVAPANNAPKRSLSSDNEQYASFVFEASDGSQDKVTFYQNQAMDNTYNNGYEAYKLMNKGQFSVYVVAEEGEMAEWASDNIENATINMQTKEATTFSLSFADVKMEGYGVRDNLTGTTTEIKEGNIYHFTTPANAVVEGRFQVVAMPKITTAVENVENATATKGIYTLTGIYMGEDFNAVPAGIYIVNGKKMVK